MINRDIYQKDPATRKLVNEGVASVNDERTQQAMAVLRYELKDFVCNGQYKKGIEDILEAYLKNTGAAQQPAAWISGFYGSGKSHLVKMLRALWTDTTFEDGGTARGIADLPLPIPDLLRELSTESKRQGGLHAASGTLGASASGSVRLALLRIVFKSAGLPELYPVARFVMWLKSEGIHEEVRAYLEQNGHDYEQELDNFYVAEGLRDALVQVKPNLFSSPETCGEILKNQYPRVEDVSSDEMVRAIRQALSKDGVFPLTLVVLDEIQQYIAEDSKRSQDVQEAVEACCKNIGAKLLFVGTGQTALTGTPNLKRLEGRFRIRVELTDADVDEVIRKVILAKNPDANLKIEQAMQTNLGEISRHLASTTIGHRQDDIAFFVQDYPLLPVRRRFWENALRVLDQTGTESQLRNQLSMVHKAIQTNLDEILGHVVPADYLYFDSAEKLLQSRILPRKVHEKTMSWYKGSADERLMARACGLIFLINKLAGSNKEIGIRATVDTLADLMVEDLSSGSGTLRSRLPALLDKCELLMRVSDEYRIQTEESATWTDEFLSQRGQLANQAYRIEAERNDRIRGKFKELVNKLSLTQGRSKVVRDIDIVFDSQLPSDHEKKICVWILDGWSTDESSVRAEALQAGNQSPTVFVFIPKRNADDLRRQLIDYKAASATLDIRGVPNTPEGMEARAAMETTQQRAEGRIKDLMDDLFMGSRVFQSGGNEIVGNDLRSMVLEAAENSSKRLYPQFEVADHAGWDKVYSRAKQGSPDALKAVADDGKPENNPVCKSIRGFVAGGKKGSEIRDHFEDAPNGWSRDAIDGGLMALLVGGILRAHDEKGKLIDFKELERKAIGNATFKVESDTVAIDQRMGIRKLLQKGGIAAKPGEELSAASQFLQKMLELANRAGGEAPKPILPDKSLLDEIGLTSGNSRLLAIYNYRERLGREIDEWNKLACEIDELWPSWLDLQDLLTLAGEIKETEKVRAQAHAIKDQRLLLTDPDPVLPMVKLLEDALRRELAAYNQRYGAELESLTAQLEADSSWMTLPESKRSVIKRACGIVLAEALRVGTREDLIATLRKQSIKSWKDEIDALPCRFDRAREMAAKELEPAAQTVNIPRRTLKSEGEIEVWIKEVAEQLREAISKGPVVIR
jgi:hypothetical protein